MTRADYVRLRAEMRALRHTARQVVAYQSMADSRLVVQIEADAEDRARIYRQIQAITMQLPYCGSDPLGFRIMSQNWARRRSHVEYRCRQRRKDAERLARHNARYRVAA